MSELTSTAVSDSPAFVRLKDKYKQELVEDGWLNKAADLAARREVLLTSHEPDTWKEPQLKAVGHELWNWVKCVRQPCGNLESPGVNAATEDGGASPLNHMMAQLVKNAASGQSPIKTPPNSRLPKRSRVPTPVVTPWTRKGKKQWQLPDTPLTGFWMLPDGYPWTLEEQLEEAKRRRDKAVRSAKRTLKGDLHLARKNTPLTSSKSRSQTRGQKSSQTGVGKIQSPMETKAKRGCTGAGTKRRSRQRWGKLDVQKMLEKKMLARISVHGARHQVKKPFGAWRSRDQSIGQNCQAAWHRLH